MWGDCALFRVKIPTFWLGPWFSCLPTPTPRQQQVHRGARQLQAALPAFHPLWTKRQDEVTGAPSLLRLPLPPHYPTVAAKELPQGTVQGSRVLT